jgi:glycosyltransferase involved in cell wall biosynthesis
MLVTIVTPTLNSERYVEETLQSVWSGDDRPGETLEHIIVDGGSTDRTLEIVGRYPSKVITGRDGGMYEAINKGLEAATGDIFSYINSDDQLMRGTLTTVRDIFARHPDCRWLVASTMMIDADGKDLALLRPPRWLSPARFRAIGWNCLPQQSTYCRTAFARELGGYDATYQLAGDYDFAMRALDQERPIYAPGPLSRFRLHAANLSKDREAIDAEARAVATKDPFNPWWRLWLGFLTKVQVNASNPKWALGKTVGFMEYGSR